MKSIIALLLLLALLGPSPAFAQTFEVTLARAPNNIPACARGDAPLLVKFVVSMSGETGTVTNTSTAHVTPYRKVGDGIYIGTYQSPDRAIFLTGVVNVANRSLRVDQPSSGCTWEGRALAAIPESSSKQQQSSVNQRSGSPKVSLGPIPDQTAAGGTQRDIAKLFYAVGGDKLGEYKLAGTVIASRYALQPWSTANSGGVALFEYKDPPIYWELKSMGGGSPDVSSLVSLGVPRVTAEQLIAGLPSSARSTPGAGRGARQ